MNSQQLIELWYSLDTDADKLLELAQELQDLELEVVLSQMTPPN